jgi:hypothetical protein
MAYAGQASGHCLSSLPASEWEPTIDSGIAQVYVAESFASTSNVTSSSNLIEPSMANSFASLASHARMQYNFIEYKCGSDDDIPMDSQVVDILYDYEISLDHSAHAKHILPELKKHILDDLADSLGCHQSSRRRLRRTIDGDVLLGFRSAQGSDVVDGKKGTCAQSPGSDGEACVPIIGHLAAFIKSSSSADDVQAAKHDILSNIRDDMTSNINSYSNTTRQIVFVSEHGQDDVQPPGEPSSGTDLSQRRNPAKLVFAIILLVILFGVAVAYVVKRKREDQHGNGPHVDEKEEEITGTARTTIANQELWDEQCSEVEDGPGKESSNDGSTSPDCPPTVSFPIAVDADINLGEGLQSATTSQESGEPGLVLDQLNGGVNFVLFDNANDNNIESNSALELSHNSFGSVEASSEGDHDSFGSVEDDGKIDHDASPGFDLDLC